MTTRQLQEASLLDHGGILDPATLLDSDLGRIIMLEMYPVGFDTFTRTRARRHARFSSQRVDRFTERRHIRVTSRRV